jgi:hypothetical protein
MLLMLLVAVPAVVQCQGNECMSPTVAVLALGECVLTVIHGNIDISTSGVGELFLHCGAVLLPVAVSVARVSVSAMWVAVSVV